MLMTNEGTPDMHKNIFKENKPKMAYSRNAFIETREDREGLERESRGTIDRLQKVWQDTIYGATADGLSQTNKIAREIQIKRARWSQIEQERRYEAIQTTCLQTNRQTDEWTLLNSS